MKTLETLANEILHKLNFETHKSTTQIVVEGLIEAQELLTISDNSKCANCNAEYERGFKDGKIMAKHGTLNWID